MADGSTQFTINESTATQIYTPCTTVTYTYCAEHDIWGQHYYCSEHNYVSINTSNHKYATDGSPYLYSAPCYQYFGNEETIRVYPISASGVDNIKVMPYYISTVAPATIPVNVTNVSTPYYRAKVQNVSTGDIVYDKVHSASTTTFSFTRPASSVKIIVEPVYKQPQTITASDLNLTFNKPNIKINATVAAS